MPRYYVYALIDPRTNIPFYIGKGLNNRIKQHFAKAVSQGDELIGFYPENNEELLHELPQDRLACIESLYSLGYSSREICRVVVRDVEEEDALLLEACLIHTVYGLDQLTNRVHGHHPERFRPACNWDILSGLDEAPFLHEWYVYILRDPSTGEVFYVGKGINNRLWDHFRDARNHANNMHPRLAKINELLANGHQDIDIGRVVARVEYEHQAFLLETLFIKFVYGFLNLDNQVAGHNKGLFRAKDDWTARIGFDLPFILGQVNNRSDILDSMLGEGLDTVLQQVIQAFPHLDWSGPEIRDANDLSCITHIKPANGQLGAHIKIFTREGSRIQIEIRWKNKNERAWIQQHFGDLNAYPLRRKDDVFFPDAWKGQKNLARTPDEAIGRVNKMLQIIHAINRDQLPKEISDLLPNPQMP